MKPKITPQLVKYVGDSLNVNFKKISFYQFLQGIKVELEHWDTVDKDIFVVAKIALDHLAEFPDYYTRLDILERQAHKDHRKY